MVAMLTVPSTLLIVGQVPTVTGVSLVPVTVMRWLGGVAEAAVADV